MGDDLLIWKMPDFELEEAKVDDLMGRVRKHKALILDLRGNPGGYLDGAVAVASQFIDDRVVLYEERRKLVCMPAIPNLRSHALFKNHVFSRRKVIAYSEVGWRPAKFAARLKH